jgi:hypothetical protein
LISLSGSFLGTQTNFSSGPVFVISTNIQRQFDDGKYKPVIKDIMYLSIAIEKTWQQSDRARDRSEPVPETPGVTHEQYQATVAAAKERMKELKNRKAIMRTAYLSALVPALAAS